MTEKIKAVLAALPEAPGIYKMLGEGGRIVYIGKSKCLKHRVKSYFVPNPKWEKAAGMVRFIQDIEIEITDTHLEAMLLECELIKKYRPWFNAIMKYDSKYVYIKLGTNPKEKPAQAVRVREKGCFGPMRSGQTVANGLEELSGLYPIKKEGRKYVFEYQIFKRKMEETEYMENRKVLHELFSSPAAMERFFKELEKKMQAAAKECRFETAMKYRDIIQIFGYTKRNLSRYQEWMRKTILADFDLSSGAGYKLFYIYCGYVVYKETADEITEERLESFRERGAGVLKEKRAELKEIFEDKGIVDFRDIVFAELAGLPEERIRIL